MMDPSAEPLSYEPGGTQRPGGLRRAWRVAIVAGVAAGLPLPFMGIAAGLVCLLFGLGLGIGVALAAPRHRILFALLACAVASAAFALLFPAVMWFMDRDRRTFVDGIPEVIGAVAAGLGASGLAGAAPVALVTALLRRRARRLALAPGRPAGEVG